MTTTCVIPYKAASFTITDINDKYFDTGKEIGIYFKPSTTRWEFY